MASKLGSTTVSMARQKKNRRCNFESIGNYLATITQAATAFTETETRPTKELRTTAAPTDVVAAGQAPFGMVGRQGWWGRKKMPVSPLFLDGDDQHARVGVVQIGTGHPCMRFANLIAWNTMKYASPPRFS
jgi:hypothetical protein